MRFGFGGTSITLREDTVLFGDTANWRYSRCEKKVETFVAGYVLWNSIFMNKRFLNPVHNPL